ncbi:hypothetical protein CLAFUR0_14807 [Fulvia fulva]|nr:hypothetical protein CLAFUR0_14807 [Fulvia fulva]
MKQSVFGPPRTDAAGLDGKLVVYESWDNEHEFGDDRSWTPRLQPMPIASSSFSRSNNRQSTSNSSSILDELRGMDHSFDEEDDDEEEEEEKDKRTDNHRDRTPATRLPRFINIDSDDDGSLLLSDFDNDDDDVAEQMLKK